MFLFVWVKSSNCKRKEICGIGGHYLISIAADGISVQIYEYWFNIKYKIVFLHTVYT